MFGNSPYPHTTLDNKTYQWVTKLGVCRMPVNASMIMLKGLHENNRSGVSNKLHSASREPNSLAQRTWKQKVSEPKGTSAKHGPKQDNQEVKRSIRFGKVSKAKLGLSFRCCFKGNRKETAICLSALEKYTYLGLPTCAKLLLFCQTLCFLTQRRLVSPANSFQCLHTLASIKTAKRCNLPVKRPLFFCLVMSWTHGERVFSERVFFPCNQQNLLLFWETALILHVGRSRYFQ